MSEVQKFIEITRLFYGMYGSKQNALHLYVRIVRTKCKYNP